MFNFNKRSEENQAISTFEEIESQQQQSTKSMMNMFLAILSVIVLLVGIYATAIIIQQGKKIDYRFVGVPTAKEEQILQQQIQELHQTHYLTADMMQIRDTVLKQQWVDEVIISRLWPNQILVKVIPRQAVARWGKSGRWVNEQGEIFNIYQADNKQNFATLSGPNDQAKYMMQMYQDVEQLFSPMGLRLVNVHLTERMTWLFQFDNGLRIMVDQNNTMLKLQQLSQIAQTELKPIWNNIIGFDLRYRDGLAIQWKSGQAVAIQNGRFLISSL